jgi:hypothetical protein
MSDADTSGKIPKLLRKYPLVTQEFEMRVAADKVD